MLPFCHWASVFEVIVSVDAPQAEPSVAMMVTVPLVPSPVTVIITPPVVVSGASCTDVGSDEDQVAVLPSSVTAGIWKVCAVLPGMNAEYIGEKLIGIVDVGHEPALLLLTPAPPSSDVVVVVVVEPSAEFPVDEVAEEPPEQATTSAPAPTTPSDTAVRSALRFDSEFIMTPSGRKTRVEHSRELRAIKRRFEGAAPRKSYLLDVWKVVDRAGAEARVERDSRRVSWH